MFTLLQSANDDQTAIGLCVLVLTVSSFFVFVSFHMGPAGRKQRARQRNLDWSRTSSVHEEYQPVDRAA